MPAAERLALVTKNLEKYFAEFVDITTARAYSVFNKGRKDMDKKEAGKIILEKAGIKLARIICKHSNDLNKLEQEVNILLNSVYVAGMNMQEVFERWNHK